MCGTLAMRNEISKVEVGDYLEMTRGFDENDVSTFGDLIGDYNPIHTQDGVVHGHLCSSMFSALLGTKFPGCLYMSQKINYRFSVHVNQLVTARVTVRRIISRDDNIILKCDTVCKLDDDMNTIIIDGHAMVSLNNSTSRATPV